MPLASRASLSCSRPVRQLPHQNSTVCRSTAPDQPPAQRPSQRHTQNNRWAPKAPPAFASVLPDAPARHAEPPTAPFTPQHSAPLSRRLPKLLASCGAVVAGLLGPLLPSWALDSFDLESLPTDTSIEPGLGDSPPLLDTLLVVVITYFTVMLLYLWLSSFMVRGDLGGRLG